MAIREDVLVVGGGLAGMSAALSAAETGATVRLLSHKKSTLRHASGLVDCLGYTGDDGPLADPYTGLSDLPDDHPYQIVGESAIREGFDRFDGVVGDSYLGNHTDANALVPTQAGTIKPTARYPASMAAGLASDTRSTLLVGFEGLSDFDAPLAADRLAAAGVPFDVRGVTLRFPKEFRADAKLTRYARALDRDEEPDRDRAPRFDGVRRALAELVRPKLDGAERVGFPSLVGDDENDVVREDLANRLGVPVFELAASPPSLPGVRLESLFLAALDEAGVRRTTGNPVVDYESEDGALTTVYTDKNGQRVPYGADQFVLATGGLVGKGIGSSRDGVREPVFDCHIPHPEDRYDWSATDAFGDQPFARFGVVPDDDLRPLDAAGDVEFSNLRAAGSVLGGADFAAQKCGSGVSLATGHVAGERAGALI